MLEEIFDDETQDEWYDADGNSDENGFYDAGGHFYMERAHYVVDAYRERMRELES
jgi:hypothetical protein